MDTHIGYGEPVEQFWSRHRASGAVEPISEFLAEERKAQPEDYEVWSGEPATMSGSWEIYEAEGGWAARPQGSAAEDGPSVLGPYKSESGARQAVTRRYPDAAIVEAAPIVEFPAPDPVMAEGEDS